MLSAIVQDREADEYTQQRPEGGLESPSGISASRMTMVILRSAVYTEVLRIVEQKSLLDTPKRIRST